MCTIFQFDIIRPDRKKNHTQVLLYIPALAVTIIYGYASVFRNIIISLFIGEVAKVKLNPVTILTNLSGTVGASGV